MVDAVVCGAAGRMGTRLVSLIEADPEMRLAGAVEAPGHATIGRDAGEVAGVGRTGVPISDDLAGCLEAAQVVIDFSVPHASLSHLRTAAGRGRAVVLGTTGFTEQQRQEIAKLAEKMPCLVAPNMSLGINVMYRLLREAATYLGDEYDVEVVEAHHHFKKDAPSGTALRLGEVLAGALGRSLADVAVYGRHGIVGERPRKEIALHAIRAGDIVGEHTVIFAGVGERLEIVHRAQSRDNFARGALRAAKWIVNQPSGLYDMQDMLGLRR